MEYNLYKYYNSYHCDSSKHDPIELQRRLMTFIGCVKSILELHPTMYDITKALEREDIDRICHRELNNLWEFANKTQFDYESFYFKIPSNLSFLDSSKI